LSIKHGSPDGKNIIAGWAGEGGHTAVPVPLFAYGPGAGNFTGVHHLSDVPKKIAALLGIKNFPR
jgi:alkaline phosphatase